MHPMKRFRSWFEQARRAGLPQPDAMALATADRRGRPSVRFVLLKQVDERGFVFFTDGRSRKGRELAANPHAALAIHWQSLGRQVRVEGRVEPVGDAESDAYWSSRPRESRLAGASSLQSATLGARRDLLGRWRELGRRTAGGEVPRPARWGGFRIVPARIEFWVEGPHRLHGREQFVRSGRGWSRRFLQP